MDEIVNTRRSGCPVEYDYIDIPEWHEFRRNHPFKKTMPFVRTRYSSDTGESPNVPRNQVGCSSKNPSGEVKPHGKGYVLHREHLHIKVP